MSKDKKDIKKTVDNKPAKKKRNFKGKASKFLRDFRGEFKKVVWPTRDVVIKNTGVTVAMCFLVAVIVAGVDIGLGALLSLF